MTTLKEHIRHTVSLSSVTRDMNVEDEVKKIETYCLDKGYNLDASVKSGHEEEIFAVFTEEYIHHYPYKWLKKVPTFYVAPDLAEEYCVVYDVFHPVGGHHAARALNESFPTEQIASKAANELNCGIRTIDTVLTKEYIAHEFAMCWHPLVFDIDSNQELVDSIYELAVKLPGDNILSAKVLIENEYGKQRGKMIEESEVQQ